MDWVPRYLSIGDINTRLCRNAQRGMLMGCRAGPARLGCAPSPFCPCVAVAFPTEFSSSGGWCEIGEGQAGVLAAHADSLSETKRKQD